MSKVIQSHLVQLLAVLGYYGKERTNSVFFNVCNGYHCTTCVTDFPRRFCELLWKVSLKKKQNNV